MHTHIFFSFKKALFFIYYLKSSKNLSFSRKLYLYYTYIKYCYFILILDEKQTNKFLFTEKKELFLIS